MFRRVLPLVMLLLLVAPLAAEESANAGEEVVEAGAFVAWLDLSGVLIPRGAAEVAYESEVYGGPLEIVTARPMGVVKAGEVLVRLAEEEPARQLRDAERGFAVQSLRLRRAEREGAAKSESRKLKLDQLEERSRRADLALRRFLEELKAQKIAQAEHNLQGQLNRLKDQREELEQLEKMYKADDLTEETEEIVLRRTRRNLARSERSYEWARMRHKAYLEITIPDEEWDLRTRARERKAELDGYRAVVAIDDEVDRIGLEKARQDLQRQKERLDDLRRDVDALRLRAPADGLAVPGRFQDGKWVDVHGTRRLLEPGSKVKARQVLYTIVRPGNVRIQASVGEEKLLEIREMQRAVARPGLVPDLELPAVVSEVVPAGEKGRYRVLLDVQETDARLLPGSSVKVRVAFYEKDDAVTVPVGAVERQGGESRVYVKTDEDGAFQPRAVKLGAKSDGRYEILEGLEAGETVRVKAAEEK